jgi:hypothetical protein
MNKLFYNSVLPQFNDLSLYAGNSEAIEKALAVAQKIEGTYTEPVKFHLYWRSNEINEKHAACIKSILATQNKIHSIHVWSTVDLSNNNWLIQFKNKITCHIFDVRQEAMGTPLQDHDNMKIVASKECCPTMESDLVRLLLLYNYGGVWADFDVMFLRDFSPILNYEFVYQWGGDQDRTNGAVMRLKEKSKIAEKHLSVIAGPKLGKELQWASLVYVKVKESFENYVIFPCALFNSEWQCGMLNHCMKKNDDSNILFEGAFAWHWHNKWNQKIEDGSKFDILRKKIDKLYVEKYGETA